MIEVLQRLDWHGSPVDQGELFILRKDRREATCKLRTHQFGWEVLLLVGTQLEVVQSQVCRTQDEVLNDGRAVESCDDRGGVALARNGS